MQKNYGPCVEIRPREDGTARLRFSVRRNCPDGFKPTTPILVDGRDGVRLDRLTPSQELAIRQRAEDLYRELLMRRAGVSAPVKVTPVIERSWEALIKLRRENSSWRKLRPTSQQSYTSTQKKIVGLLGSDPALAPSIVLESQLDRIFTSRIDSLYGRKRVFIETRRLLEKATREGWRDPALTLTYSERLPKPKIQIWTPGELRCMVTAALAEGERGLARLLVAQWEVGQRLQSVRNFRWGYHYKNGCFSYLCVKGEREVRVDVVNASARRALEEDYRHGDYMFLSATTGKPFTGAELSRVYGRLRKKLRDFNPKLQIRQLRHTVILELALSGCNIPEIATITTHDMSTVHRTLEAYLRPDSELARNAMEKRERRRLENVMGLTGELIVEGTRRIFIGDRPQPQLPTPPEKRGRHEER